MQHNVIIIPLKMWNNYSLILKAKLFKRNGPKTNEIPRVRILNLAVQKALFLLAVLCIMEVMTPINV